MPTTTTTIETPTTTTTTEPYVPDDDMGDDDCTETDVAPACVKELLSGPTPAKASAPDHQFQAKVATNAGGDVVVVWSDGSLDDEAQGVYARLFTNSLDPVTTRFRVSPIIDGYQGDADVAMYADGSLIVVWTAFEDGDPTPHIYVRRFDDDGDALGGATQIDPPGSSGLVMNPDIAVDGNGLATVAWGRWNGSWIGVEKRQLDGDGDPVGGIARVDTGISEATAAGNDPCVSVATNGNVLVTWKQPATFELWGNPASGEHIYGRLYDDTGDALTAAFRISEDAKRTIHGLDVASAGNAFVVAWADTKLTQGSTTSEVRARRLGDDGEFLDASFAVRIEEDAEERFRNVTATVGGNGEMTFAWSVAGEPVPYARTYTWTESPIDSACAVGSGFRNSVDGKTAIAMVGADRYVVAWSSETACDEDDSEIYFSVVEVPEFTGDDDVDDDADDDVTDDDSVPGGDWEIGYAALKMDNISYPGVLVVPTWGPTFQVSESGLIVSSDVVDGVQDFRVALVRIVSGFMAGAKLTFILGGDTFVSGLDLMDYLDASAVIGPGAYSIDVFFALSTVFTAHGPGHDYAVTLPGDVSLMPNAEASITWIGGEVDDDTSDDDTVDDDTADDDTADDDTSDVWEIGYGPLVRDTVEYSVVLVAPVLGPAETVYGSAITAGLEFLDGADDLRYALVRFTDGELDGINATMMLGADAFATADDLADYFDAAPTIGPDAYVIDAFYPATHVVANGAGFDYDVTIPGDAALLPGTQSYIHWIGGAADDDTSDDDTVDDDTADDDTADWEIGWSGLGSGSFEYPVVFVVYQEGPGEIFAGQPIFVGSDVIDGVTDFHIALVRFVDGTLAGTNMTMLLANSVFDTTGELAAMLESSPEIEPGDFVVDADFVGDYHFAAQGMGYDYAVVLPQSVSLLTGADAYIRWIGQIDPIEVEVVVTDIDTQDPIEDAECVVVSAATGAPLTPEISATTDANGVCVLAVPESMAEVSVSVSATGYATMYRYAHPADAPVEFMMMSDTMIADVADTVEVTPDPQDGMVLGIAFWATQSGSGPVGCAQVASDSGQNTVYYLGDTGISSTRGGTWPDSPGFFLFDVPPGGPYEFTATAGTTQVATDVPVIVPDAVTFVLLFFHDETNPTPVGCE